MNEDLFEVAGVTVTITGVYGAFSVIVLILFMSLWLRGRKKRTGQPVFAGQVMNGIGFGLLPAIAVLKAFQEMSSGAGAEVHEPMPVIRWLTDEGFFRPGRIETMAALACFAVLCLWLVIRKEEMPDNGDLFMIALCVWASIRLVTEDFRAESYMLFRFTSCGTVLGCLAIWVARRNNIRSGPGRAVTDLAAAGTCIAINLITAAKFLTVGSEIGDFAVKTGSAVLLLTITLIVGGDLRKMLHPD